ncbi:MAG: hypothetical protein KGV57_04605, partial [Fusobacterium sp.]|nr:hypothetical protein [Fusobacterium sp.]
YIPKFSSKEMDKFLNISEIENNKENKIENKEERKDYIEKNITSNDIRARIFSCPTTIMKQLEGREKIDVIINEEKEYKFSINKGRNFLSGVTDCLREYGLLTPDNVIIPKKSRWYYDNKVEKIIIYIGKEYE